MNRERRHRLILGLLLACAVVGVYGQVRTHGFVEYDDPGYVSDNSLVRRGLTWEGVRWAFTAGHMGNWHPLTWLSHMLDVQWFGLHPGAHHLVSVAFHLANTLLLFAVLHRMTRGLWPSLVVAALFALHPLHVESVAWISERKDVLSTFFWFLTLGAYTRYVEARSPPWYAATAACFALGLMAKPMLVTLPFVLLLLDIWPLGRLPLPRVADGTSRRARAGGRRRIDSTDGGVRTPLPTLLWEKAPLLALTIVFSVVAYIMQLRSGAMVVADALPLGIRVANALVAYIRYLLMAVWPVDLAVLYPYDTGLPAWRPIAAALALLAVSLLVLRHARRHPYALVGWLWYLGTLVPVIGLVQIGSQALADRYTYVPLVGIFVILAWGGRELIARWAVPASIAGAAVAAAIAVYAVVARAQVDLWRTGELLLAHTVRVTRENPVARNNLGVALATQGKLDAASEQYREALRIKPDYADAHHNVGLLLWRQGRREEAAAQYRLALRYTPDSAESHSNLGLVLTEQGKREEAIMHLTEAVRLDPQFAGAYNNLGNALRDSGRQPEAIERYEQALRIRPDYPDPYNNIGAILAQQGRREEAAAQFRTALRYDPTSIDVRINLGLILSALGKQDEAIAQFTEAVRLGPDHADVRINLGDALRDAGRRPEAVEQYENAVRLAPDSPAAHYKLGLALTEGGRGEQAIEQFQRALQLNPAYPEAHNDLGVALVDIGRLSEAIGHFERALELDPNLPDAQYNLEVARMMQQGPAEGAAKDAATAGRTAP